MLKQLPWLALPLFLAACSASEEGKGKGNATPTVGFVVVNPTAVPEMVDLPGRVVAFETSEVRPQVSGIVRRVLFTQGTNVRAGQPLYQIDTSLYKAAVDEAQANLNANIAKADAARELANRYRPLAKIEAVSQQDYADAVASERSARAAVAQTRAQLNTAQINLRFATVSAPISGRIGRSIATQGALVSASQTDALTTIQRINPVYVDVQQSSAELVALRRALAEGGVEVGSREARLTLEDGSEYPSSGRIQFSEAAVNPDTGTVTIRAQFENPSGVLLPGMFVRARFAKAVDTQAFLVPQAAVAREANGKSTVWVVAQDGTVTQREVSVSRSSGANWVVMSGLSAGERIVTQGTSNLQPNMKVKAVPEDTAQRIGPETKKAAEPVPAAKK